MTAQTNTYRHVRARRGDKYRTDETYVLVDGIISLKTVIARWAVLTAGDIRNNQGWLIMVLGMLFDRC